MLTPEAMLNLAAELTDAAADDDAASLAAIAWRLYGEAGENLAEIGRLRAALHAAWNRPQETASPAPHHNASPRRRPPPAAAPGRGQAEDPGRAPGPLNRRRRGGLRADVRRTSCTRCS